MIDEKELYMIGTLTRTHGTSGEVQCHTTSSAWEDGDGEFVVLMLDQIPTPFRVTDWRTKGAEDLLLQLDHVDSEAQAQRLIGAEVYMRRADMNADEDETTDIRWSDLVGWTLTDSEQGQVGTITAVDETTANILLSVLSADGVERLLPLHEDFIAELDSDNRHLIVCFPFQL